MPLFCFLVARKCVKITTYWYLYLSYFTIKECVVSFILARIHIPVYLYCREAYKSKHNSEVARAYVVLTLCGVKPLVKHNAKVSAA